MAINRMRTALDRKMRVTKTALTRVRKGAGQETYRPLEIYMKLEPDDFSALADTYGLDQTIKYIQAMENRRMKGQ